MIHDARIVPIGTAADRVLRRRGGWGIPAGRYQGETLIVESVNFNGVNDVRGSDTGCDSSSGSAGRTPIRCATSSPSTIRPPSPPWTAVLPMTRSNDRLFDTRCHEGNYALMNILRGARAQERVSSRQSQSYSFLTHRPRRGALPAPSSALQLDALYEVPMECELFGGRILMCKPTNGSATTMSSAPHYFLTRGSDSNLSSLLMTVFVASATAACGKSQGAAQASGRETAARPVKTEAVRQEAVHRARSRRDAGRRGRGHGFVPGRGIVRRVLADLGDAVQAGQPLVELDREKLQYSLDQQRPRSPAR